VKLDDALRDIVTLGIDTAPFIYLVEDHPRYGPLAFDVFRRIDAGRVIGITSVITLGEVLVHPLRHGNIGLHQEYRDLLLESQGLRTVGIDVVTAEMAALLRATYGMLLPDALQIAVALREGGQAFLTNDRRLARVTEIRVLVLDDLEL
jgi:predicted nucleic acid-binding protein